MPIDKSTYEHTTALSQDNVVEIDCMSINGDNEDYIDTYLDYQFRYTVHRQFVGFFTPMVYDVEIVLHHDPAYRLAVITAMNSIVEPFVEGALMVDDESFVLTEMLKGQNFGYNRLEELQRIRSIVKTGKVWYSDWENPPLTIQNQRIFVYNVETHASLLDPVATLNWILIEANGNKTSAPIAQDIQTKFRVNRMRLTAGYTQKVAIHSKA